MFRFEEILNWSNFDYGLKLLRGWSFGYMIKVGLFEMEVLCFLKSIKDFVCVVCVNCVISEFLWSF